MSIKLIQQENGFTLVEIMIALLILAGGLMATAYMQTRSVGDGTTAHRLTRRVTGAEDLIEDFYIKDIKPGPGSDNLPELPEECEDDFYIYEKDPKNPSDDRKYPMVGTTCEGLVDSPYYDIEAQARGGEPLKNLTTIQITLTPNGENTAATARRTIVLNFVRSTKYNE
jgi:prepilin-type N-terminal cleavage/methylation domain-containing protein